MTTPGKPEGLALQHIWYEDLRRRLSGRVLLSHVDVTLRRGAEVAVLHHQSPASLLTPTTPGSCLWQSLAVDRGSRTTGPRLSVAVRGRRNSAI